VLRKSRQIHGDVDLKFAQYASRIPIALGADVDEIFKCVFDAPAHLVRSVRPIRDGECLETLPVMPLDRFHQQMRDRMRAKIRRQICHADSVVPILLAVPDRRRRRGVLIADPGSRAEKLLARRSGQTEKHKRWTGGLSGPNVANNAV
jgi:hypothetical protein